MLISTSILLIYGFRIFTEITPNRSISVYIVQAKQKFWSDFFYPNGHSPCIAHNPGCSLNQLENFNEQMLGLYPETGHHLYFIFLFFPPSWTSPPSSLPNTLPPPSPSHPSGSSQCTYILKYSLDVWSGLRTETLGLHEVFMKFKWECAWQRKSVNVFSKLFLKCVFCF